MVLVAITSEIAIVPRFIGCDLYYRRKVTSKNLHRSESNGIRNEELIRLMNHKNAWLAEIRRLHPRMIISNYLFTTSQLMSLRTLYNDHYFIWSLRLPLILYGI